jgi:uncharacterized DUF497 family protein
MKFEWDEEKAHRNILKHGISFDQAITAFDDPFALIAPDEKHSSEGEIREWLIGESDDGVLVVVFTRRWRGQICRIISARRANRRERKRYEEFKRISL